MGFSATDAAFEGFRLARAHPRAVALWAVASLVFNLLMTTAMITLSGRAFTEMIAISESGVEPDPQQTLALMGEMSRGYLVMLPLMFIFMAVFAGAVYRASSRPEDKAFGYLRLGATELRLLVVTVVVGLLGLVVVTLLSMAAAMVGGVIAVAAGGGVGAAVATVLTMLLIYVAMIFAGMAFYVKFSFAGPMTFLKGRIDIFGSWKATAGRFWPLFGCYFLAVVLGLVVSLLGMSIGFAALLAFGGDIGSVMSPDLSSLAAYFTPAVIAYVAVSSIFTALTYAIFQGPAMAAYRAIHDQDSPAIPTP